MFKVAIPLNQLESPDMETVSRNPLASYLSFFYLHSTEFSRNDVLCG
jgi:hypothetical protein